MATEKILIFDEAGNAKRMKVRIARFLDNEPVTASDKENIRTTLDVDDSLSGTFTTPLSVTSASDSSFTGGGNVTVSGGRLEVESTTGTATTQALTVTDGSSTNFVVQENGRVGVGTASPSAKLHLQDTGVDVGLSIDRTDAKKFNLYVDSGGNLITRDQSAGVSRVVVLANGDVHYQTSSAELGLYNDLIHGSISRAFIKCEGRTGTFNYGGDLVVKLRNDDYTLSERARFTENGLCFNGDTAAANAISDYEEGSWTPVFAPQSGSFAALTMNVVAARYVKIGHQVTVNCYILTTNLDTTGASGQVHVSGLPYPNAGSTNDVAANIGYAVDWTEAPSGGHVASSASYIVLNKRVTGITGSLSPMDVSGLATGSGGKNIIMMTATYNSF